MKGKTSIKDKLKTILEEAERTKIDSEIIEYALIQAIGRRYYYQILYSILRGKVQMSIKKFEIICSTLGVRNEFAKKGIGHPFIKLQSNVFLDTKRAFKPFTFDENPLRITASESYLGGTDSIWRDPVLQKELDFIVMGTSMEPQFVADDILKCELIESINEIKNGENYVFNIRGYDVLMLKQVEVVKQLERLNLVSLNKEHQPFVVDMVDIVQIYRIVAMQRNF